MSTDQDFDPEAFIDAVRAFYAAIGRFDATLANRLKIDLSSLRAIDSMKGRTVSPKMLSEELSLNSASVTALLDRLEKAGYITRTPSKTDRRSWDIGLTKTAQKAASDGYGKLGKAIQETFANRSAEEVVQAIEVLEALIASFATAQANITPAK